MTTTRSDIPIPGDWLAPRGENDAQRVQRGIGLAAVGNAHGVFAAADLHITDRLIAMSGGSVSEGARLATALAVRAVRLGSTCLALDDAADVIDRLAAADPAVPTPTVAALLDDLKVCPLVVGTPAGTLRPLVLMDSDEGPLLYLRKYFRQEQAIRAALNDRASSAPDVDSDLLEAAIDEVFSDGVVAPRQRIAAALAARRWTTILAGGPGTGKTYTVARILAVLDRLAGGGLRIGMCAPTGRAAAQLQASVLADGSLPGTTHAVTLHRLLGWRPGSAPRHGRSNRLAHDVIVVDETSMLSMTAMSRLLDAIRADTRLILVGDPHQLASVEAGAVLADLVDRAPASAEHFARAHDAAPRHVAVSLSGDQIAQASLTPDELRRLGDGVVTLREGFRFGSQIAKVAEAVNAGDADTVLDMVRAGGCTDVALISPEDVGPVHDMVADWGRRLWSAAMDGDVVAALDALDTHRILCAHREGAWGVQGWQLRVADWLSALPGHPRVILDAATWTPGQPILVTANDRQTDTFNGDCGVVVRAHTVDGGESDIGARGADDRVHTAVAFRRGNIERLISPARLADTMPAYAMTIHRSQGSQFDTVTVVLPPTGSELLTRELLYTAITRARSRVQIVGTPEVLGEAVGRRVHRASGLRSTIRPVI
ncbi:MAG: exodeoxyribonuclease V subunit alpha [Gordonia sp. (in: high G+C Gram-positive bacteria)]